MRLWTYQQGQRGACAGPIAAAWPLHGRAQPLTVPGCASRNRWPRVLPQQEDRSLGQSLLVFAALLQLLNDTRPQHGCAVLSPKADSNSSRDEVRDADSVLVLT